jgi:hypothetical protein
MIRIVLLVILLVLILVFGGVIVASAWDPSPPATRFEKVVPDERFPR